MDITVPHNFTPRPYQLDLFQALDGIAGKPETKKKRAFLVWHRRAGKDKACFAYLAKAAMEIPGNYFYIFPTAAEGRRALWENVDRGGFRIIDHIPSAVAKPNNSEMLFKFINGSTVRVMGLDNNIDAIRGVACRGAVFSEFAYQDPDAYKVLMPAIRESEGWVIFNSTPNGPNHMYKMDVAVRESARWYYSKLQTLWPDREGYTGLVPQEEFEEIITEEGLTQEDVEREYGCSYSAVSKGAIYQDCIEKVKSEGRFDTFGYNDQIYVDTFWDLGYNDYTAIWFRQVQGNRIIWIDYFEDRQKGHDYYVDMLKEKGYKYRTHYIPHDGAQHSRQTGMDDNQFLSMLCKEANIADDVVTVSRMGKQAGINATRARFGRMHFNKSCLDVVEAVDKLSLYHRKYDTRRDILLKEPVHDWTSHCADALRTEASYEDLVTEEYENSEYNDFKVVSDYDIFDET